MAIKSAWPRPGSRRQRQVLTALLHAQTVGARTVDLHPNLGLLARIGGVGLASLLPTNNALLAGSDRHRDLLSLLQEELIAQSMD
jgi:hypothetical protein